MEEPNLHIFADVDGTLVPHVSTKQGQSWEDSLLEPDTLQAILKARRLAIGFSFITGRTFSECAPLLSQLRITDLCAFDGGSTLIWPLTGKAASRTCISAESVGQVSRLLTSVPTRGLSYIIADLRKRGPPLADDQEGISSIFMRSQQSSIHDLVPNLMTYQGISIARHFVVKDGYVGLTILPSGVDKGTASTEIARLYGLRAKSIASIGDDLNDVGMFQRSGYAIAMGNGARWAKQVADHTVDDILDGGGAQAIARATSYLMGSKVH